MSREQIVVLGVNHKTTPVEIREKMAISSGYEEPLSRLRELGGVRECCLLSTCNRVEVSYTTTEPDKARKEVAAFLFGSAVDPKERQLYLYAHEDLEAVRHLFLVAASLDSMIVGETQILGQLKDAYRHAVEAGTVGPILNRLFHKAFTTAKRVRTETRIGAMAVSVSYAAVELARKIFGDLRGKSALLVGAGEMAELAAEHFVSQGVEEVVVANRTLERAMRLARRWPGGRAVSLEELTDQLALVDIVVSSTGAEGLILTRKQMQPVLRRRRGRPLFLIDIAVPRDIEQSINTLDNVYLYDVDDLRHVVDMNRSEREREAVRARRIVDEEVYKFQGWLEGQEVTPTIKALRSRADALWRAEAERTLGRLSGLNDKERKAVEKMAASIAGKMLHHPMRYLKDEDGPPLPERIALVRRLFGLDEGR